MIVKTSIEFLPTTYRSQCFCFSFYHGMNSSLWYRFEIQSRESLFMSINIGASFAPVPTSWLASFYCNMYGPGLSKTINIISVRTAIHRTLQCHKDWSARNVAWYIQYCSLSCSVKVFSVISCTMYLRCLTKSIWNDLFCYGDNEASLTS